MTHHDKTVIAQAFLEAEYQGQYSSQTAVYKSQFDPILAEIMRTLTASPPSPGTIGPLIKDWTGKLEHIATSMKTAKVSGVISE